MCHLAPKIWKFSRTPPPTGGDNSPLSSPHWAVASALAILVSLTSIFHMQQRCYFFLARTLTDPSLEPECASWAVQPGLCVWVWSLEWAITPCERACIVHHSADTLCCCYRIHGPGRLWPLWISSGFCCYQARMDPYWGTVHACIIGSCRTFRKSL